MAKGQSQKFQKTPFLLTKLKSLKLCPLAILMPLEENPYKVPDLRALLISGGKIGMGRGLAVL